MKYINFKPLILAVTVIFTITACQSATTPPVADYPVTASYKDTFLKNHSRNTTKNNTGLYIGLGVGLFVMLLALSSNTNSYGCTDELPVRRGSFCYAS